SRLPPASTPFPYTTLFRSEHLRLPAALETSLIAAIDAVFSRHERLWQESKHEAIQALSAGFADKMSKVQHELSARDATVSSISRSEEHTSELQSPCNLVCR